MTWLIIILVAVVVIALLAVGAFVFLRQRSASHLKTDFFQTEWQALQKLLRDKTQWSHAVVEADKLLDVALKKKHMRGRTMGSRLVRAQRLLTDNDSVWFGHKLRAKIDADPTAKLKQSEVKQALTGIRQALKDLGALLK